MPPQLAPPRAVIFDLGDVLFTWSARTTSTIPASELRQILSTPIWHAYDRGEITRDACYELSARKFGLQASEVAEAFAQARKSCQPDTSVVALIRDLSENPATQVYAMSNIGKEDFEELATRMDWTLFDQIFTSAAAGMRKPELAFYRHVLDHIGLRGDQVVFIDDKKENVQAARALGIRGQTFGQSTILTLRTMMMNPISRGWQYLFQNAGRLNSVTNSGVDFEDNFAKLLIADTLPNG